MGPARRNLVGWRVAELGFGIVCTYVLTYSTYVHYMLCSIASQVITYEDT